MRAAMGCRSAARAVSLAFALACGDDDDGSASEAGTAAEVGPAGDAGTAEATGSMSGGTAVAESGGSDTSMPDRGTCASASPCRVAADCCVEGQRGCPDDWPFAFTCEGGWCIRGGCESDAECEPGLQCHAIDGDAQCLVPCPEGSECGAGFAMCTTADDGAQVCVVGDPPDCPSCDCVQDADCAPRNAGNGGLCDVATGECYCTDDGQCAAGHVCLPD
jgi:hypothetical protein